MELKIRGRCGAALEGMLVVDAHGHLGNEGIFSVPISSPEGILDTMDRIGIDVVCVSHLMALRGYYREGNDRIAAVVEEHPQRFLGYACPDPNCPEDIEAELDRCFGTLGLRAIKIHASFQEYPIDGPGYQRVYAYAEAHGGIPVLGHGFSAAGPMERIARSYPGVPFIVAHFGGSYHGRFADEMVEVIRNCDNVFTDLVHSVVPFGGLEVLVDQVGADKLLYGSDICYQEATHQIGRVLFARISELEKEKILGLNAARLLGLDNFRLARTDRE
jgi:predicted TIM-barrel fold metal-dependent hydrolase